MKSSPTTTLLADYGSRTLSRARSYVQQARVLEINADESAQHLTARVGGSRAKPYKVEVDWRSGYADGLCSCPVEFDCKHAAAAVMAFFESGSNAARGLTSVQQRVGHRPVADRTDLALKQWLEKLGTAGRSASQPARSVSKEAVLYVLDIRTWPGLPSLRVTVCKGRQRKDGTYGGVQPYDPRNAMSGQAPQFVGEADVELFYRLQQAEREMTSPHYLLVRGNNATLLPLLLETGRCFWVNAESSPLRCAKEREGQWQWVLGEGGEQTLTLTTDPAATALPVAPPWYVDTKLGTCGPLRTDVPDAMAQTLLQAPGLLPEHIARVKNQLAKALPTRLPQPRAVEVETRNDVVPTPILRLGKAQNNTSFWYGQMAEAWAQLAFDYDGIEVDAADSRASIDQLFGTRLLRIERNIEMEDAANRWLDPFFPCGKGRADLPDGALTLGFDDAWLEFIDQAIPQLEQEGWRIEFAAQFPVRNIAHQDFEIDIQEGEDWFGVGLGVEIDGERHELLPLLLKALESLPPRERTAQAMDEMDIFQLPLDDERSVVIPASRIKPILSVLIELFDKPALNADGHLQINRLDAVRLADIDDIDGIHWHGGEALKALADKLRDFQGIQRVAVPKTFHGELRDYQHEGLNWLQFLRRYEFGGILADDMGLGKTVQTLAHLLVEKKAERTDRPNLLIVPTSLLHNWQVEAERFAPSLRVLILHGPERAEQFARIPEHDLVITTYPLLPRDADVFTKQPWHYVILDEAQVIKNPRTKAARTAYELSARHRLCLTGTPMENHLGEMWSLFRFLMPGFLGDSKQFQRLYRTPIEKHNETERRAHLARRVRPFMLRRTKDAVAKELPPKTEIVQSIDLEGAQRDLYESIRLAMHKKIRDTVRQKGFSRSHIEILEALLKLRQVCCDPRLLKNGNVKRVVASAKLDHLEELLPVLLEEGRRVLLFSQFTEMLGLIEEMVQRHGIQYTKLTGRTRKRAEVIEQFQSGAVPLMLVSLKAGGVGLNLTAADTVIHYDPWWNPAVESQATDRAHRIGQDKPVFVYKLICTGTVEERIQGMQQRKQALLQGVYAQNQDQSTAFNKDDLEALFEPI